MRTEPLCAEAARAPLPLWLRLPPQIGGPRGAAACGPGPDTGTVGKAGSPWAQRPQRKRGLGDVMGRRRNGRDKAFQVLTGSLLSSDLLPTSWMFLIVCF